MLLLGGYPMSFEQTTPLFGTNAIYVEQLYQQYLEDPSSVDDSWSTFFADMGDHLNTVIAGREGASWAPKNLAIIGVANPEASAKKSAPKGDSSADALDSINALMLIRAFKVRGNLLCDLDPLGIEGKKSHPDLDPATYGFTADDMDRKIFVGGAMGLEYVSLRDLLAQLKHTYSGKIGVEFMHIPDLEQRNWIADRMEGVHGKPEWSNEDKKAILEDIVKVEEFEQFLHRKFPGAKRFSAEGGESVIAAMEKVIERAAKANVREVIIGMPHRGRLNVLTKVMGRPYASMLSEFMGNQIHISEEMNASGDVKYHQGASSDRDFGDHRIHLSLTANPSHLEAVNPVVIGRVRAKQDQFNDADNRRKAMGLLLHGDASFAGQGVVPETLMLGDLEGYTTGGTLHLIVNNQIGFTTNPARARKSPYPSDVAKAVHAPIFHVNGDDPEAVVFVATLAFEFRQKFGKDVIIDVFCYRRYGHNEGDEPFFTQPLMYNKIKNHPTPMHVYGERLIAEGVISEAEFLTIRDEFKSFLDGEFEQAQDYKAGEADWLKGSWKDMIDADADIFKEPVTGIDKKQLSILGEGLSTYPSDFNIHPKLKKLLEQKKIMLKTGKGFDWAMGEALAYASLLAEGHPFRMSGQDCVRGTFSHRHAGLVDQKTEERYFPLNNLGIDQKATAEILESNLSEFAVMGFEHGYSLAEPNALVIWEAQFGDFANGAQVMIDQFIASSEAKWLRLSGLVLLLPHGYEGQGPEHSSARPERFLQLCAEDNMQVVSCTTPANFFHVIRRQLKRKLRKPLVVMSPKSLLRHKLCVSNAADFIGKTSFQPVIGEVESIAKDDKIRRVVVCSGKVYYDLLEARTLRKIKDVAIVRLEQFYPFCEDAMVAELKRYKNATCIWCQEEPQNMGGWYFLDRRLEAALIKAKMKETRPVYVGRKASASPAAGYGKIHKRELDAFIDEAFA